MQSIPLAVLKPPPMLVGLVCEDCMQSIPLAVLKLAKVRAHLRAISHCMQSIPLAVLKQGIANLVNLANIELHAIHTACGIETLKLLDYIFINAQIACNPYRLRY